MLTQLFKFIIAILCGNFIDFVFNTATRFADKEALSIIAIIVSMIAIAWRMYYLVTLSFITSPLFWISVILTIVKNFKN